MTSAVFFIFVVFHCFSKIEVFSQIFFLVSGKREIKTKGKQGRREWDTDNDDDGGEAEQSFHGGARPRCLHPIPRR